MKNYQKMLLGATTVLTTSLLLMESKDDMPKIDYLTALDVYMVTCFAFVISPIVEFAFVHYHSKLIFEQDLLVLYRLISLNKRLLANNQLRTTATGRLFSKNRRMLDLEKDDARSINEELVSGSGYLYDDEDESSILQQQVEVKGPSKSVCFNLGLSIRSLFSRRTKDPANTVKSDTKIEFLNDISDIDYYAKIIFPTCFFTFNLVYWVYYLGKRELYL
jgi:hypothetical protein